MAYHHMNIHHSPHTYMIRMCDWQAAAVQITEPAVHFKGHPEQALSAQFLCERRYRIAACIIAAAWSCPIFEVNAL